MRILGTEPSSVIHSQTKYDELIIENLTPQKYQKKKAEAKWDGV